ncbi:hypothetical protein L7834_019480, partial [Providencia rettgeri]|uniref:hypothetical protein n=2 Tax=Providencia rettgeri TaxID=587 RepID=UPI001EE729E2
LPTIKKTLCYKRNFMKAILSNLTKKEEIVICNISNFIALFIANKMDFFRSPEFSAKVLDDNLNFITPALSGNGIMNAGGLTISIYMLLVSPYEMTKNNVFYKNYNDLIDNVNNALVNGNFGVNVSSNTYNYSCKKSKPIDFIRHMRNSASHTNISFDGNKFIFFDTNSKTGESISFSIPKTEVGNLLVRLLHAAQSIVDAINNRNARTTV